MNLMEGSTVGADIIGTGRSSLTAAQRRTPTLAPTFAVAASATPNGKRHRSWRRGVTQQCQPASQPGAKVDRRKRRGKFHTHTHTLTHTHTHKHTQR